MSDLYSHKTRLELALTQSQKEMFETMVSLFPNKSKISVYEAGKVLNDHYISTAVQLYEVKDIIDIPAGSHLHMLEITKEDDKFFITKIRAERM